MGTLTPSRPTESKNIVEFGFSKKMIQTAGIAILAASISKTGVPTIDISRSLNKDFRITNGDTSMETLELTEDIEKNKVYISVFNNPTLEYAMNNQIGSINLNGSILEANELDKKSYDYSIVDEIEEVNFKSVAYDTFEIEEEDIIFEDNPKYDFSKVTEINEINSKIHHLDSFRV